MTATVRPVAPADQPPAPLFVLAVDLGAGQVAIHGDLDRDSVDAFVHAVDLLAYSPSRRWCVDVSAVAFCDAGGLRGLLAARRLAEQHGATLRVTGVGPWMERLLPMVGLSSPSAARTLHSVN